MNDAPATEQVAMISSDPELIGRVGDAAAAAGLRMLTCPEAGGEIVGRTRAVLVGLDAAPALVRTGVPRRVEALIVGSDGDLPALWKMAGDLGAGGAVSLPSGSAWLVQWLHGRVVGPATADSLIAAVFSAAGGVGASTLAAGLAVTAAGCGLQPMLIDAHPGPAGVELLLGDASAAEHWSRFASIRGFLAPEELHRLPVLEGVRCLGWGNSAEIPLWQGALGSVVNAARHEHDLVVVDAGLHPLSLAELPRRTRPILLLPASWRGSMAAAARLPALRQAFDQAPLVVLRDVGGKGDPRAWLRDFPDCEVLLLRFDPTVIDDEEQCRPPGSRSRSAIGRLSRQILAAIAEPSVAA